jgi:hypothetical protein
MSSYLDGDDLRLYLPRNLPQNIITGNGEKRARIAYFGHLLTSRPYDVGRDFIALNMTKLRDQVSKRATEAAFKTFADLIEIDPHYKPKVRSKGYRWKSQFCGHGAEVQTFHCPRFKQHLRDVRGKARDDYGTIQRQLDEDLQGVRLEISNLPIFIENLPPKPGVKCEQHRRTVIKKSAEDVINGNRGLITTSDKTGRIHCLPNRLCTHLRSELSLYGSEVVEIDLASSQPYFLATLFDNQTLKTAVSNGEFYHRINEKLINPIDFADKDAYGDLKQSVLSILYATPHPKHDYTQDPKWKRYPVVDAMSKAYDGLMEFIALYRRTHGATALPIAMQRLESEVFINTVLVKLQSMSIPAIPIHDAILCRIEDGHTAQEIIYHALMESTGIKPTIKPSKTI